MAHPTSAATISSVAIRKDPATGWRASAPPGARRARSGGARVSASARSDTRRTATRTAIGASARSVRLSFSATTPTSRASAFAIEPSAVASIGISPSATATTLSRKSVAASSVGCVSSSYSSSSLSSWSSRVRDRPSDFPEMSPAPSPGPFPPETSALSPYPSRSNTSGARGATGASSLTSPASSATRSAATASSVSETSEGAAAVFSPAAADAASAESVDVVARAWFSGREMGAASPSDILPKASAPSPSPARVSSGVAIRLLLRVETRRFAPTFFSLLQNAAVGVRRRLSELPVRRPIASLFWLSVNRHWIFYDQRRIAASERTTRCQPAVPSLWSRRRARVAPAPRPRATAWSRGHFSGSEASAKATRRTLAPGPRRAGAPRGAPSPMTARTCPKTGWTSPRTSPRS